MKQQPIDRIKDSWAFLPAGKRLEITGVTYLAGALFFLWEVFMGKKSNAPRVVLVLAAVAYTAFAITFFSRYPGVVYVAGFVLGGVLLSLFVIWITGSGKKPKQ